MAQSIKCLTLDFGSGRDLMVHEFEAHIGLHAGSVEPAWNSLFLSLPLPAHSVSLLREERKRERKRRKDPPLWEKLKHWGAGEYLMLLGLEGGLIFNTC